MISPETIKKLHELNCEDVARRLGLEVNMHQAHCFMHQDKRPSLAFKNNLWKCFACDKGGDAISLVEEKCDFSFVEACTWLCEQYNIYLPSTNLKNTKKRPKLKHRRALVVGKEESRPDFDSDVASAIINLAELETKGKDFLFTERKLSAQVVEKMKIKSVEDPTEIKEVLINTFGEERLIKCKVLKRNKYNVQLTINIPSLLIPYFDMTGKLVALQSRYLGTNENIPRFKMLCNSRKQLYNIALLAKLQEGSKLYIMEGITDCLAMLSAGYPAVAIQSATTIPETELDKLSGFDLVMVHDNDKAGVSAFYHLHRSLLRYGCRLKCAAIPTLFKDYSTYYLSLKNKKRWK